MVWSILQVADDLDCLIFETQGGPRSRDLEIRCFSAAIFCMCIMADKQHTSENRVFVAEMT